VRPVRRGSSAREVRPRAGAATVGATAVTGAGAGATGLKGVIGSTVTWITDSVGLKNMVMVAAACLSKGCGILRGDSKERDVLSGEIAEGKGPIGSRGGKNGTEG
jgi:hypothetical protein